MSQTLGATKSTIRWHLNNLLLYREEYYEYIRKVIKEFGEFNEGSVDDIGITWDAFKAFIRGVLFNIALKLKY